MLLLAIESTCDETAAAVVSLGRSDTDTERGQVFPVITGFCQNLFQQRHQTFGLTP